MVVAIPINSGGLLNKKGTSEQGDSGMNASIGENTTSTGNETEQLGKNASEDTLQDYEKAIEERIEKLLENVNGVGKAEVMISYESGNEDIALRQEKEEVILIREGDKQVPYIVKTIQPKVLGIAVVADGGDNEYVKKEIMEMLQALFAIEINKIKILKRVE